MVENIFVTQESGKTKTSDGLIIRQTLFDSIKIKDFCSTKDNMNKVNQWADIFAKHNIDLGLESRTCWEILHINKKNVQGYEQSCRGGNQQKSQMKDGETHWSSKNTQIQITTPLYIFNALEIFKAR